MIKSYFAYSNILLFDNFFIASDGSVKYFTYNDLRHKGKIYFFAKLACCLYKIVQSLGCRLIMTLSYFVCPIIIIPLLRCWSVQLSI